MLVAGEIVNNAGELRGVFGTVIGRYAHAEEQHARSRRGAELDYVREIAAHLSDRKRTQTVVAAQLQDDDLRMVERQRARQSCQAPRGRFAADAGIDDLITVPLILELRPQQATQPCSTRASP